MNSHAKRGTVLARFEKVRECRYQPTSSSRFTVGVADGSDEVNSSKSSYRSLGVESGHLTHSQHLIVDSGIPYHDRVAQHVGHANVASVEFDLGFGQ